MNLKNTIVFSGSIVVIFLVFQNCSDFQATPSALSQNSSLNTEEQIQGSGDQSSFPDNQEENTGDGTQGIVIKPMNTVLKWSPQSTQSPRFVSTYSSLRNKCKQYRETVASIAPVQGFYVEGLLSTHPQRVVSDRNRKLIEQNLLASAYCIYAGEESEAQENKKILLNYIFRMIPVYVGGVNKDKTSDYDDPGNPINEQYVLPVVYAIDLTYSFMNATQKQSALNFVRALRGRVANFMNGLNATDKRLENNWMMTALYIQYIAAKVGRNPVIAANLLKEIEDFLAKNLEAPAGWRPSSCNNLAQIGAYGSFDLQQRDAFRYHTTNFQTAFKIMVLGDSFQPQLIDLLSESFGILAPYVRGEKVHLEFECTNVEFDRERRQAGDPSFSGPYDPVSQKYVFFYANKALPETKAWTDEFNDMNYRTGEMFLLHGKAQ